MEHIRVCCCNHRPAATDFHVHVRGRAYVRAAAQNEQTDYCNPSQKLHQYFFKNTQRPFTSPASQAPRLETPQSRQVSFAVDAQHWQRNCATTSR